VWPTETFITLSFAGALGRTYETMANVGLTMMRGELSVPYPLNGAPRRKLSSPLHFAISQFGKAP
jgi:hypothetical protein